MSIDSISPCLSNAFAFLPLHEQTACSRVSRSWHQTESVLSVIDTVGLSISKGELHRLVRQNAAHVQELRVSVRPDELGELVEFLRGNLIDLPALKSLSIFSENKDRSVFLPDAKLRLVAPARGYRSRLILQVDPGSVAPLIELFLPTVSVLVFLRGCVSAFPDETTLSGFLEEVLAVGHLECLLLGEVAERVDMDRLLLKLMHSPKLRMLQWAGAGASLEILRTLLAHPRMRASFDGMAFLAA